MSSWFLSSISSVISLFPFFYYKYGVVWNTKLHPDNLAVNSASFISCQNYYFTYEFFFLAGGLPLESERKQVSSKLQDFPRILSDFNNGFNSSSETYDNPNFWFSELL